MKKIVEKSNHVHEVFWQNPPQLHNTCLLSNKESSYPVLEWSSHMGISFPVSDSMCTPLFCLSMYIKWHLANPTAICPLKGGDRVLFFWGTRGVLAGHLFCIGCWEKLAGNRELNKRPMPTIEGDLALPLPSVSKVLFHFMLVWAVFSLATLIPRSSGWKSSNCYSWW